MTKFATIKLTVETRIANISNSLTRISMRSYVPPFLYRVGMSKLFYSFSVGFNSASYFVKGPIKNDHDALGFD